MVGAVDFETPRSREVVGEVPATLHWNADVIAGMDDECGHGDRRQYRPDVDPEASFECGPGHPGARTHALQHSQLAGRPDRRDPSLQRGRAAPGRVACGGKCLWADAL